jgi:hypothetical protein
VCVGVVSVCAMERAEGLVGCLLRGWVVVMIGRLVLMCSV